MASLDRFNEVLSAYYSSYRSTLGENIRRAEQQRATIAALHSDMDLFTLAGKLAEYTDALVIYRRMLTLMAVSAVDEAWEVTEGDLMLYFASADPSESLYRTYTDGVSIFRNGIRDGGFMIDKALTGDGFSGTEGVDWINLVKHE